MRIIKKSLVNHENHKKSLEDHVNHGKLLENHVNHAKSCENHFRIISNHTWIITNHLWIIGIMRNSKKSWTPYRWFLISEILCLFFRSVLNPSKYRKADWECLLLLPECQSITSIYDSHTWCSVAKKPRVNVNIPVITGHQNNHIVLLMLPEHFYTRFSQRSRFGSTRPPSWAPK